MHSRRRSHPIRLGFLMVLGAVFGFGVAPTVASSALEAVTNSFVPAAMGIAVGFVCEISLRSRKPR